MVMVMLPIILLKNIINNLSLRYRKLFNTISEF